MFGYDLKQAATYFLKDDKKAIIKLIVLSVLAVLSALLGRLDLKQFSLYQLILIIPALYLYGYLAKNTNCRIVKPENKLPELNDWKNYLIIGFKNTVGMLAYILPIIIMILNIAYNYSGVFIFLIIILPVCIVVLPPILCALLMPVQIAFCTNLKFKSMFDFKLIKQIIFKDIKLFAKLIAVMIILAMLFFIIGQILAISIIGIILIPFVPVYLFLIVSDLYGQFINKAIKQNEVVNR